MQRLLVKDIKREEQNMLLLRHHYLSKEQVQGYRYDLGLEAEWKKDLIRKLRERSWPKHVYIEEPYGNLRHKDAWGV